MKKMKIVKIDGVEFRPLREDPAVLVSESGRVVIEGIEAIPYTDAGGYKLISLGKSEYPESKILRHRLVCMTWKDRPDNWRKMDVNHKNNTPGDDWADNLEWCTRKENIEHAVDQLRFNNKMIYIRDEDKWEIRQYESLSRLSKAEGISTSVSISLSGKKFHVLKDGKVISYDPEILASDEVWGPKEILRYGKPVLINRKTGESKLYPNITALCINSEIGIARSTLSTYLATRGSDVTDDWRVEFNVNGKLRNIIPWEKDTKTHVGLGTVISKTAVRCYNTITGEERHFESVKGAARELNIPEGIITQALTKGCLGVRKPHYRFTRDPEAVFPSEMTLEDIRRVAGVKVITSEGVSIFGSSMRIFCVVAAEYGLGSETGIRKYFMKFVDNMAQQGNVVRYYIGGIEYDVINGDIVN